MKHNAAFLALSLTVFAPCGAFAQDTPVASDAVITAPVTTNLGEADLATYRLDTGDTVSISVERHPDVSRTVPLLSDAAVVLPRVAKPIPARGMTCAALAEAVHRALNTPANFRLTPGQVTVSLVTGRMRRVFVRGNAITGRDVDLKNGWRVTELVAVLGGIPQPDRVHVTLTNAKRPSPITVDLDAALASEASLANIALMEGDTVVVNGPRNKILFVQGEGPRGRHEVDERYTLKQALVQLGISQNNASGELRKATLTRHTVPGDVTSPTTRTPIDLIEILTSPETDHDLRDNDTIEIPLSQRFYFVWGELGGARKRVLPEDRKTYLLDVMSDSGNTTTGQAKIGAIEIHRGGEQAKQEILRVDYGKFLGTSEARYNPEILPGDLVIVPNVKRVDAVGTIWTSFGLYNLARTFLPGLR